MTDFREEIPGIPLRLGAIGPLIFVGVLLNQSDTGNFSKLLILRPLLALICAAGLSAAFALSTQGIAPGFLNSALRALPVATAWILLTVIVVRIRALSAANPGNHFLRWLLQARIDSAENFVGSLRALGQTEEHVVLGPDALSGYSIDLLFDASGERTEPLDLSSVRSQLRRSEGPHLEASEQLSDLFETHEMTHALLISRAPPLIVLLNLPQGANAAAGQLRAAVIQRLARRLAQVETANA